MLKKLIFILFLPLSVFASHSAAVDLTYICLGNNTYEVTLDFYRDCIGINAPISPVISVNNCYNDTLLTLTLDTFYEVEIFCDNKSTICDNNSSVGLPGYEKYSYKSIITFDVNCSDILLSYSLCCRNVSITNLNQVNSDSTNGDPLYVEAYIRNSDDCNSSISYNSIPIVYRCVNIDNFFNSNPINIDNDSTSYELILTRRKSGTIVENINFINNYNLNRPFDVNNFSLNNNGDFQFNSSSLQIPVITIKSSDYRNGELIGYNTRDIQIVILDCLNNPPDFLVNYNSNLISGDSVFVCSGGTTPIFIDFFDIDNDSVIITEVTSNINYEIINNQIKIYPETGYDIIYQIMIKIKDDGCLLPLNNEKNIIIIPYKPTTQFLVDSIDCYNESTGRIIGLDSDYQYEWDNGEVGRIIDNLPSGNYGVSITDTNNCQNIYEFSLKNPDKFEVWVDPEESFIKIGDSVLINIYSNNDIDFINISPNEFISCDNCEEFYSKPIKDIVYDIISLSVDSCYSSVSFYIFVDTDKNLYIPNAFTPNSDGINDIFYVYGNGFDIFNLKIFNRWGELIFESNSQQKGWNGKFKGETLRPGVFVYVCDIQFLDGVKKLYKGSITLIR